LLDRTTSITDDLTPGKDKPAWPISSYGCAKFEPTMIAGLDQSPEEMRVMALKAIAAGNANEYVSWV